ncbi:MAG TPA: ABC transporter substrate-binding protein [Bacillota bacterium]|nr:ABC transporter substrate-binding protein [Bacillota bacterium]
MRLIKGCRILKCGFTGLLYGYIISLLLSQWIWLEMRITVALAIPVGMLLGAVVGAFVGEDNRVWGILLPEILLLACLGIIYRGDLGALAVIPAILLREAFHLGQLDLQAVNIILVLVLIAGNLMWFCKCFRSRSFTWAALILGMVLLSGCGQVGNRTGGATSTDGTDWAEIEQQARGTEVRMIMWGGDENVNRYMDKWVAPRLKEQYGISFVRVPMDAPQFMQKLLTEKKASRTKGTMDIIWINGENFNNAKQNGLLSAPFLQTIPNYKAFVDENSKNVSYDFGIPVENLEAPWGKVQFIYHYDSARIKNPPKSFAELAEWIKANPGRFTYPEAADFTGNAFLRHLLYASVGVNNLVGRPLDSKYLEKNADGMWEYLNQIQPYLWRRGETYPQSLAQLDQLYSQGEVWLTMGYNEGRAEGLIRQGMFPKTTKSLVFNSGSIGNTHFLAIPYNAPNQAGAMTAINFLLSPQAQLAKLDPAGWGDNTVLAMNKLPEQDQLKFRQLNRGASVLPAQELESALLPEVGPQYVDWIKEKWTNEVVKPK